MLQKTRSIVNLDLKHSRIKVYGSEAIKNMINVPEYRVKY